VKHCEEVKQDKTDQCYSVRILYPFFKQDFTSFLQYQPRHSQQHNLNTTTKSEVLALRQELQNMNISEDSLSQISNHINSRGVEIERIKESEVFASFARIYLAEITTNMELLRKWKNNEPFTVSTE
jgi:hypothetical protein